MRKTDTSFNFTRRAIETLSAPVGKRLIFHDTQVPELGLMIQPTGHRSLFWFRKVNGVPTWKTIGPVHELSLEQARDKARQYSVTLREWKLKKYQGDNPFEEKRHGELSFGELVDAYIDRQLKQSAKRPEKAEKSVRWTIDFYLKDWKNKSLSEIRRANVLKLFADLGERRKQITANRVVQLVRTIFNFAVDAELWKGENPARNIKFYHEAKRTRFLQPDELARLYVALKNEPNSDLRDFVNLSLWTGARKSDVMAMRWLDISLRDNRWTVPEPKNRKQYVVPLTPEAVKVLKNRQKAGRGNSDWVFPSHGVSGHVVDLKRAWKLLLERAKIMRLRQHDLRRTQGSWQAAQGSSLIVIGKSLGHSSISATQIYSQLQLDPVRTSMEAANAAILEAMKRKPKPLEANRG